MKKYLSFLLLSLLSVSTFAQENVLAKIGNNVITQNEFIKRFEFTPRVDKDSNIDSLKSNFLYTLIAEKLWAMEARKLNMDKEKFVIESTSNIEKKLILDKLYKEEIESKVKLTDEEIRKGLRKLQVEYLMGFINSTSKKEIEEIYSQLNNGIKFESILSLRPEAGFQGEGIRVRYGQMNEALEDELFLLNKGEFSKPISSEAGYTIYYIKDKYRRTDIGNRDQQNKFIKDYIFGIKAKSYYSEFFNKFIKGNNIDADKDVFNALAYIIFETVKADSQKYYNEYTKLYNLDYYTIRSIGSRLTEEIFNKKFIKFEKKPIKTSSFLTWLALNGMKLKFATQRSVLSALNTTVKDYIFKELLAREAFRRNYHKDKDIIKEVKIWQDSFLASYYMNHNSDKINVDEIEIREFYNSNLSQLADTVISFEIISSENLDLLNDFIGFAEDKDDFKSALNADSTKSFVSIMYQKKNNVAYDAEDKFVKYSYSLLEGNVFGAIPYEGLYHYVKLNTKRARIGDQTLNFNDVKRRIESYLFNKKNVNSLEENTVNLALDFGISADFDKLKSVKVNEVPMLVYRNLGFGEQINAVPYLQDFSSWKNKLPIKLKKESF